MNNNYTLECSVDSVESALNAAAGGATRLELCSGLLLGGITPDLCLFRNIKEQTNIPIYVLIRPRFGDFLYSDYEIDVIKDNVSLFRHEGADGIVIGSLTQEGDLDMPQMSKLIELSDTLPVTLHRAFDVCRDPFQSLQDAKILGISTILTSGQKNNCYDGRKLITSLIRHAGNDIDILVGAGVNADVISKMIPETGARHFHMSGKQILDSAMRYRKEDVNMGLPGMNEYQIWQTDKNAVMAAKAVLDKSF